MAESEVNSTPGQSAPATVRRKSRARIWSLRIFRTVVLIYVGLCIVMFSIQDWMMFPGHATQGQRQSTIRSSTDGSYDLVDLTTASGDRTTAMFGRAVEGDSRHQPTVIFFYGNGMCLADCFGIFREMRKLGVNVLAVEYVGYGMSTGKPSERALYETADAAWDHLQTRSDIDKTKIIAAGWSLGGAVAIDLASRKPVIGLATFSAFTSAADMAHDMIPWLPTSLLLRNRFDNLDKIGAIKCPIFLAHGNHDAVVPHQMRDRLARAATASSRVSTVMLDSNHGDVFERGEEIYGPLGEFFKSVNSR